MTLRPAVRSPQHCRRPHNRRLSGLDDPLLCACRSSPHIHAFTLDGRMVDVEGGQRRASRAASPTPRYLVGRMRTLSHGLLSKCHYICVYPAPAIPMGCARR